MAQRPSDGDSIFAPFVLPSPTLLSLSPRHPTTMRTTVLLALPALALVADARMHQVRSPAHHRHVARQAANTTKPSVAAAWFEGWNANFTAADLSWERYTHVTYSFAYVSLHCYVHLHDANCCWVT